MTFRITRTTEDNGNYEYDYTALTMLKWLNEETKKQGVSNGRQVFHMVINGGTVYIKGAHGNQAKFKGRTLSYRNDYLNTKADS